MAERFYITTPLYYVNDAPHIGHTYTTVAADIIARYRRLLGDDVWFLTGTDEHGQKVFEAAARRGLAPQAHVDELCERYVALWGRLNVRYNDFIRTTEPRHKRFVAQVLTQLYERGDIYKDSYSGWYSTSAERFWTEKDLVDGKCPESGLPVEWIEESNYFFRMSKYADQVRLRIAEYPDWVRPEARRNELLGLLRKEVGDLCITRPKDRLPWGIPIPFDDDYVTYVWFDALLNYISAIYEPSEHGEPLDRARFPRWPADFQLLGKDILTTHTLYWGTMLAALGLEPADCVYAHGWWTVEGRKMSKSVGNVVDPNLLVDAYGADPVRYVLMAEKAFGADGDFSHKGFQLRYNADLANDIGNLVHRSLSMTAKWLGGVVPELDEPTPDDDALSARVRELVATFDGAMKALDYKDAVEALVEISRAGNKYVDTQAPWSLNRDGKEARLAGVMRRTLELCRVVGTLLWPFCPNKANELLDRLAYPGGASREILEDIGRRVRTWHPDMIELNQLFDGASLTVGEPLFPRMTELPDTIQAALEAASDGQGLKSLETEAPTSKKKKKKKRSKKAAGAPEPVGPIEYDDFAKVQLKVGRVISGERHPDADRLLVLQVDVGEDSHRTIVAGIAKAFTVEELVGTQVVVVANLAPIKLRGVESQGMILAAGGKDVRALVSLSAEVEPGEIVR